MKLTKQHYIIFLILLTEVLGFSLILPFLPFMAQEMGASAFVVGLLLTVFSLFQFISAPIFGSLSDKYGRKPLLIISQLATLVSFVTLGLANSIWMLFASRIIDGLLGSNATIAKAYLSDITSQKDKSKVFAVSGTAFAIGIMIGPLLGGTIAQTSYAIPSFIAAGITFFSIFFTIFALPETIKPEHSVQAIQIKLLDLNRVKYFFTNKKVNQQLFEYFAYVFAMAIFTSSHSLFSKIRYNASTQQIGLMMTAIGATNFLFRGLLIPKLIDRFKERNLERFGLLLMIISLSTMVFINSFILLLPVVVLFAIGTGLNYPLMMGDIARSVDKKEQGAILGVANSLDSFAHIIGPLVGGILLSTPYPNSILLLTILITAVCLWLVMREKKEY